MKLTDDDVVRAIERAQRDNLQIEFSKEKNVFYVESTSEPGRVHRVYYTPRILCDCTGYFRNGHICKHTALAILEAIKMNLLWACPSCFEIYALPLTPDEFSRHSLGECAESH